MRACDVTLPLTLEELHNGCTKRRQPTPNGPIHRVDVKPGYRPGDKVRFGGMAYVVAQREHERFVRCGDDLHTHLSVPLGDALSGFAARVEAIDGEEITVASMDILKPGDVSRIADKGMSRREGDGRGDLIVHFDVVFPDALLEDEKDEIRHVLTRIDARVNRAPSMFNLRARALSEEALDHHHHGDEFRSIGSWGLSRGRRFSRESKVASDSKQQNRYSRDSLTTRSASRIQRRAQRNSARSGEHHHHHRKLYTDSITPLSKPKRVVQKLFARRARD